MQQKTQFGKIAIVGIGLMGGSLGLAIRRKKIAGQVIGLARRRQTLEQAKKMGCIDKGALSPVAVTDADLVVLAGPVGGTASLLRTLLPHVKPGCLITDVGSTKTEVLRQVTHVMDTYYQKRPGVVRPVFIGSHPMAGSEKAGVTAAYVDLYKGALCLLMPVPESQASSLERLKRFWRAVGCSRLLVVKPMEHDAFVATVSHLPHVAAVGLTNQLRKASAKDRRVLETAASGFRDTTRIAAGLPTMWLDILMTNHQEVSSAIDGLIEQLKSIQTMLKNQKKVQLLHELEQASRFRLDMEKKQRGQ